MKSYQAVYQILAKDANYISGEKIAEELSLSRTSIWKAIRRLEQEGIEIDSIKNKGYKLVSGDLILPEILEENLPIKVSFKPETRSTQLDAKEAIDLGNEANTLYLASYQTAGRGRFQRSFYSPQGGIYMTLHLKPNLPYDKLPSYTLLVAGAIYKAIKNLTLIDIDIKWVNDIYLKNQKIGGILTEAMTSVETSLVTDIIIGVGINFTINDFPQELKEKAASLFKTPAPITRNELIIEIWRTFFETPADELLYLYKKQSFVLGKEVAFTLDKKDYKGLAKDISESGKLLVQCDNGKEIWLNSGEISLKSWK